MCCPPPGDLPYPGIKPRSPTLQASSLPSEPPGNLYLKGFGLPWWLSCNAGIHLQCGRPGFYPWVGKIPWRREQLPTLVFLPGESYEQKSLAGSSPWGPKEST